MASKDENNKPADKPTPSNSKRDNDWWEMQNQNNPPKRGR